MSEREIDGRVIETSNEDKVFFPDSGITKGDLMDYYARVAEVMIPHTEERPISMHRFPDGIEGKDFYHKDIPDYFPDWIPTARVEKDEGANQQVVCNDAATLVYIANQGTITPHTMLSRTDRLHHPDKMIFDLDPPDDDFALVREGARRVRELLDDLEIPSFVMTTGSRGLHIMVPLDRSADFDEARDFAHRIADLLEERYPEQLTSAQRKAKREGRLFIDYLRNGYAQTGVAPYAVRAREGAPVATPVGWDEVDSELTATTYRIDNIFRRLAQKDDPWRDAPDRAIAVSDFTEKLEN